jgi:predicted nicotinamide N-methyase
LISIFERLNRRWRGGDSFVFILLFWMSLADPPKSINPEVIASIKAALDADDRFTFVTPPLLLRGAAETDRVEYLARTDRTVRCTDRTNAVGMLLEAETIPQYAWPAALPLAHWLVAHNEKLRGLNVLELGSGVGLGGLTAALYARHVVLTDCSPVALAMLEMSVQRHTGHGTATVELLKWGNVAAVEALLVKYNIPAFDLVIGCDIFYFNASLTAGLATARAALLGRREAGTLAARRRAAGSFLCASFARSERMDVDIDEAPLRSGFRGGRVDTLDGQATDDGSGDGGLRIYEWFPEAWPHADNDAQAE